MRSAARPRLRQGMLYVGCYDNNLYALNAADGKFQWKYATEGGVVSRPACTKATSSSARRIKRLHVISARTRQGAVDLLHGRPDPLLAAHRRRPCLHRLGRRLPACRERQHQPQRLEIRLPATRSAPRPMIANELIYVGTRKRRASWRWITAATLKWRFQAKRGITSSPAASAPGRLLLLPGRHPVLPGRPRRLGRLAVPAGQGIGLLAGARRKTC